MTTVMVPRLPPRLRCGVPAFTAIVGRGREGRRKASAALADRLVAEGLSVGGFRQVPVYHDRTGERIGYELENLDGGERHTLAYQACAPLLCDLAFVPEAFAVARRWTLARSYDVAFVECGRLEAQKTGHWPLVLELLGPEARAETAPRHVVLSVRPVVTAPILLELPDPVAWLEIEPLEEREEATALPDLRPLVEAIVGELGG